MPQVFYAICTIIFCLSFQLSAEPFGYISHSTINIGDDIQSIAAKRFLPENALPVDREFISQFTYPEKVKTVVSGWFMHHTGGYWDLKLPPPQISWPPSSVIDPFFISIHFTGSFFPMLFSEENIDYLKKHAPIGARDMFTLKQLEKRGIDCYFSGCLTLTLENNFKERNNITYLVDLDQDAVEYIKSKITTPVIEITHGKSLLSLLKEEHRIKYADYILNLYRKCKCVVTTRLHAAMPCLAFETPILMISSMSEGPVDARFRGLHEHAHHCSKEKLLKGECEYDFNNPPANPGTHIPMREDLIKRMQEWVQKNSDETVYSVDEEESIEEFEKI